MKLTLAPDADALYLRLNEGEIADSEQVAAGVVLDYDAQDNIVGMELLHVSKRGGPVEAQKLTFEILRSRQAQAALRETAPPYGSKRREDA